EDDLNPAPRCQVEGEEVPGSGDKDLVAGQRNDPLHRAEPTGDDHHDPCEEAYPDGPAGVSRVRVRRSVIWVHCLPRSGHLGLLDDVDSSLAKSSTRRASTASSVRGESTRGVTSSSAAIRSDTGDDAWVLDSHRRNRDRP